MTKPLGHYFIDLLSQRGIQYFFANPGTEFTSIIEAFAAYEAAGISDPKPVMVPHETAAVNMAYGAYLASGRPQAVMVHATIGAANAAAALINASRMNIPLLFIAGRTPITESGQPASRDKFIHWAQESYDQGGMFREYTKWDYELRQSDHLQVVLDRALSIMNSPPKGPVYLQLPRERLMEEINPETMIPSAGPEPSILGMPGQVQLRQLANELVAAARPIIMTKTVGENPEAVAVLEAFSEHYAIPVITPDAHYYNISTRHPMFCGYHLNAFYKQADLVLNLGMDVPWSSISDQPPQGAKVIHIAEDPLFQQIPIRTHRGDTFICANIEQTLLGLDDQLKKLVERKRIDSRRHDIKQFKQQSQPDIEPSTLTADAVALALNDIWDEHCVLINELSLPVDSIQLDQPGCYFRTGSASGLGWGLGAAVGIALAAEDKVVIAVVGDGSYYFSNPAVIHWLAKRNQLKLLTVVLNNDGMKSIQRVTEQHFPMGAASREANFPLTSLEPATPYEKIAAVYGAHAYCVERLRELKPILEEAMQQVVQTGNQALVNIRLSLSCDETG